MSSKTIKNIKILGAVFIFVSATFFFNLLIAQAATFFNCDPDPVSGKCRCSRLGQPICIGFVNQSYTFESRASDPEGDPLYYTFFWNDASSNTRAPSSGTVPSGTLQQANHSFSIKNLYSIYSTATDVNGNTSSPSSNISCDIHNNALLTVDFDSGPSRVSAGTIASYSISYTVANDNAYGLEIKYTPVGGGAIVLGANPTWNRRVGDTFYWDFNTVAPGSYSIQLSLRINSTVQNHVEIKAANGDLKSDDKWVIVGEAWWQTIWGDIHSNGGINNRETRGNNTADAVITARQGINSNVTSGINQIFTPYPPHKNLVFAAVDKQSLTQGLSPNCSDSYWQAVHIPDSPVFPQTTSLWGNGDQRDRNIRYCDGNLTIAANPIIPKPPAILNSEPPALFLARGGTVVVDGDLSIANNVYYDPNMGTVDERAKIPSAGFVVGGDLIIQANVEHIVGNFYVLGDVYTADTEDTGLVIEGSLVARNFLNLERRYTDASNTPAELVKYDGRVLVNPPPGFLDPATLLPCWAGIKP
ncbi:MAG: hypothetical protein WC650_05310 [Candidatus Doudnabacteria bacterium]